MNVSPEPSPDESRVRERQLYRPGQIQPAPKPAASARPLAKAALPPPKRPARTPSDKPPLLQRRLVRGVLAAAWLLMLGGVSYCVFLPDPVEEARRDMRAGFEEMRAVSENKDLTQEQKREKFQEIREKIQGIRGRLTSQQRLNLFMSPERRVQLHDDMEAFFKLPPEQQAAQLRKEVLEWEKRRAQWRARWRANGGGRRGPGRGGPGGRGGPRGGGWGGRGGGGGVSPFELIPPETRQQMRLKRSMMGKMRQKMGIKSGRGFGGRGGGPPR